MHMETKQNNQWNLARFAESLLPLISDDYSSNGSDN